MGHDDIHPRPASYEHLYENESLARGGFRLGILAAAAIHLTIFAITWPTMAQRAPADPPRNPHVYQLDDFVFERPQPKIERPVRPAQPSGGLPIPVPFQPTIVHDERHVPEDIEVSTMPPQTLFPERPPADEAEPITVNVGDGIAPPVLIHRVKPHYPAAAKRIRLTGAVVLEMLIDIDGRVADISVLRGQPFGLTESAVDAARQWRFKPSTFEGRKVNVRYTLTIRFHLDSGL